MKKGKIFKVKPNFVKVLIKDNGTSHKQCGSPIYCNETR